jgi:hypothetical protein
MIYENEKMCRSILGLIDQKLRRTNAFRQRDEAPQKTVKYWTQCCQIWLLVANLATFHTKF